MEDRPTRIASLAVAVPPLKVSQPAAGAFLVEKFRTTLNPASVRIMERVFSHPSIRSRQFALDNPEMILETDPDRRIERFIQWSVELGVEAIEQALQASGCKADCLSAIVVNTCTSYICPGLSTYLIERLGLRRDIRLYDLVGSGCGGAIPNLQLAQGILGENPEGVVASLSVEICSCTFQMGDDLSLIVSNALFGDGAAAALLWKKPKGLTIVASASHHAPEYREEIRFVHKQGQLHNQLSPRLPGLAAKTAAKALDGLFAPLKLTRRDVRHWALHPGGENVVNALRDHLGLSETQLAPTRQVLANYGNMSSPTVWFVLREIQERGIEPGEYAVMLAFGAGLSAHAMLLQA
jgi:predicted naringenin-chalcone synthase